MTGARYAKNNNKKTSYTVTTKLPLKTVTYLVITCVWSSGPYMVKQYLHMDMTFYGSVHDRNQFSVKACCNKRAKLLRGAVPSIARWHVLRGIYIDVGNAQSTHADPARGPHSGSVCRNCVVLFVPPRVRCASAAGPLRVPAEIAYRVILLRDQQE